jgi:hypothetical protein
VFHERFPSDSILAEMDQFSETSGAGIGSGVWLHVRLWPPGLLRLVIQKLREERGFDFTHRGWLEDIS